MKKKIVALSIMALSSAAFAQANVTVYGTADVSVQGQTISQGVARDGGPAGSVTQINSNGSLLGFKGTESLGNGNKALFQIETQVNLNGSQNGTTAVGYNGSTVNPFGIMRDSFIGFDSKYGTVKAGYLSTPYRATLLSYDVFPGDYSDASVLGFFGNTTSNSAGVAGTPANAVQNAAIRATALAYQMPTLYGITGSIAYTGNGGNNGTNNQVNNPGQNGQLTPNGVFGFNLGWSGYGVGINGAFQQAHYTNTPGFGVSPLGQSTNYLIGAQYTGIPGLKTGVVYGRNIIGVNADGDQGAAKGSNNSIWVGASYRFGNNEPRVSWGNNSNTSGLAQNTTFGSQNGANQWNLGWGYYLSKRTQVYGLVSHLNNNANGVTNFINNSGATLTGGEQLTTYGVGMRTNF